MEPLPKGGLTVSAASWTNPCYPCQGKMISDYGPRSGRMHTGVDIKAQPLDTIRAVADGVVRMSVEYSGYGNMVLVRHANGLETLYGHNTRNLVVPNQAVRGGQAIALAGRTGRATTEHCHFEVRAAGECLDPNLVLDCAARRLRPNTLYIRMSGDKVVASTKGGGAEKGSAMVEAVGGTDVSGDDYYIVQAGDTLFSIYRRYGVSVARLCELNGIDRSSTLSIGQKILLK